MGCQYALLFLEQDLIPVFHFKTTKALDQEGHCSSRMGYYLECILILKHGPTLETWVKTYKPKMYPSTTLWLCGAKTRGHSS